MNTTLSRRQMLTSASTGFGMAALAGLMQAETPMIHRAKRFAPKARSVIFCYMSGGVSHVDSFDYKPRLISDHNAPYEVPKKMLDAAPRVIVDPDLGVCTVGRGAKEWLSCRKPATAMRINSDP